RRARRSVAAAGDRLPLRARHGDGDRADGRAADDAPGRREAPRDARRRWARRVRAPGPRDAVPPDGDRRGVGRSSRRVEKAPPAPTQMSLYDSVRHLPLHVDGYYLEPLEREVARGFTLRRTVLV